MFSKELNTKLDRYHLLTHPFYQVFWNEGKLTREIIKDYAEQYYQHVKAFPRYISATHSLCEDIEKRKILLENLNDEENSDADHPKLWKNFALAMDADAEEIEKIKQEFQNAVMQSAKAAGAGNLPGGVKRMLSDLLNPQLDWRQLIAMQIQSVIRSDYTYQTPSRKGQDSGFYLPGMDKETTIDVAISVSYTHLTLPTTPYV